MLTFLFSLRLAMNSGKERDMTAFKIIWEHIFRAHGRIYVLPSRLLGLAIASYSLLVRRSYRVKTYVTSKVKNVGELEQAPFCSVTGADYS